MDIRSYLRTHTNPPVFLISLVVIVLFLIWGVSAPKQLGDVANGIMSWITTNLGWWYLMSVFGFLVFVLIILFSPYGRLKLGKDNEEPEWSTWSWFSMLFTAGMGIGLVFFGVAEPIEHLTNPPDGTVSPKSAEAAIFAMHTTYFHWGLHPWAIYIIIGMSMGYFCFRHDLPLRPASAFYPLIGRGIYGWIGHAVDILAVFGTLFGLATSLGLGASQIASGLSSVFGIPDNWGTQVIIVAAVTAVAVTSVMLGLDKGIRRLSVWNMSGAIILAIAVFLAGPTLLILQYLAQSVGYYIQHLPATSLNAYAFNDEGQDWISSWTLFYWGWWIAWSPFVGMFIARVSRGRTVRQFVLGTLIAPVGASMVWFAIFGGSAVNEVLMNDNQAMAEAGTTNAMFVLMDSIPFGGLTAIMSLLAILVVAIFFATSSDSGSLVVDMLTNGGDPHPKWQQRLFWAVTEGAVAAILLVAGTFSAAGNPLSALQTAAIASGFPFSIVLAVMCWGLVRGFRRDVVPPPLGVSEEDWSQK